MLKSLQKNSNAKIHNPMKTSHLNYLLFLVIILLPSCDKAKIEISFNMDIDKIYFTVEPTSSQGNMTFATTTFASELQKKLDDNNANIDDVESIELTGADFNMINPGGQNFDIVDKAYAYLSTSSIPETRIAHKDPVPDGVTSFSLTTEGGNLKDYLNASTINFRATGFTNGPNVQRDSIQAVLSFKIKAKVKP